MPYYGYNYVLSTLWNETLSDFLLTVGIGYQYKDCGRIFWKLQSATLSGYDISSSEIGGWNFHIHHTYNFQEGLNAYF